MRGFLYFLLILLCLVFTPIGIFVVVIFALFHLCGDKREKVIIVERREKEYTQEDIKNQTTNANGDPVEPIAGWNKDT